MARTVLIIGAAAWLLAGAGAFTLAAIGTAQLIALLPPLAIDADAVGGALTALALTLVVTGTAHLLVVAGLRDGRRGAKSAGVLLTALLAVVSIGLTATAVASAVREPAYALPLMGGAVVGTVVAIAYLLAAVGLARELGAGSAS